MAAIGAGQLRGAVIDQVLLDRITHTLTIAFLTAEQRYLLEYSSVDVDRDALRAVTSDAPLLHDTLDHAPNHRFTHRLAFEGGREVAIAFTNLMVTRKRAGGGGAGAGFVEIADV